MASETNRGVHPPVHSEVHSPDDPGRVPFRTDLNIGSGSARPLVKQQYAWNSNVVRSTSGAARGGHAAPGPGSWQHTTGQDSSALPQPRFMAEGSSDTFGAWSGSRPRSREKQSAPKSREPRQGPTWLPKSPSGRTSPSNSPPSSPQLRSAAAKSRISLTEFYDALGPDGVRRAQGEGQEQDEEPSRILWVGNIGPDVSEEDLEQTFSPHGKIESLRILHDRYCAFVNYEGEESAKKAKKLLHGTMIGNQFVVINFRKAEASPVRSGATTPISLTSSIDLPSQFALNTPSRALWLGNVDEKVTEEDLVAAFEDFGEIESVRLLRAKTCAFVNFTTTESAVAALSALQGKLFHGTPIKINFGKPQSSPKPLRHSRELPQPYVGFQPGSPYGFIPYYGMHASGDFAPYMMAASPPFVGSPMHPLYIPQGLEAFYQPMALLCELCTQNTRDTVLLPCQHGMCDSCSKTALGEDKRCPWCKNTVEKTLAQPPVPTYMPHAMPYLPPGYPHVAFSTTLHQPPSDAQAPPASSTTGPPLASTDP